MDAMPCWFKLYMDECGSHAIADESELGTRDYRFPDNHLPGPLPPPKSGCGCGLGWLRFARHRLCGALHQECHLDGGCATAAPGRTPTVRQAGPVDNGASRVHIPADR